MKGKEREKERVEEGVVEGTKREEDGRQGCVRAGMWWKGSMRGRWGIAWDVVGDGRERRIRGREEELVQRCSDGREDQGKGGRD